MTEVELWTADRKYDFVIHLRERIRPRFWYLTFVNCGADVSNVPIRYSIRTTNDKVCDGARRLTPGVRVRLRVGAVGVGLGVRQG